MLRKMGKSGLEVQEIKKDIKNQKFEIQKEKKKGENQTRNYL